MALYTKAGDDGFASLPGDGRRVRKDDARLAALGDLDELASAVGFCLVEAGRAGDVSVRDALATIQKELFQVGSAMATKASGAYPSLESAVTAMERHIDAICAELPELNAFILPGGCELAARLHLARTTARRAERAAAGALNPSESDKPPAVLRYINRLSDLLFALARLANHNSGQPEATPKP